MKENKQFISEGAVLLNRADILLSTDTSRMHKETKRSEESIRINTYYNYLKAGATL